MTKDQVAVLDDADFAEVRLKGMSALFVNSEKIPTRREGLPYYTYSKRISDCEELIFSRLYKVTYTQNDELGRPIVNHSVYEWYIVQVPTYHHAMFKTLIDSMKSLEVLLNR